MATVEMIMIRSYVTSAYDLQKLRMQVGARISANFLAKLKIVATKSEAEEIEEADATGELSEEALDVIKELRKSYQRLTDGMAANRSLPSRKGFVGDELITDYTELVLIAQYFQLESQERKQFSLIKELLDGIPIYDHWLSMQKGIGPAFAGVFLGYFDINKGHYVSDFWAYAGLDVGFDGYARSKRKEHLIERTYTKKDGTEGTKMSTTYNPWLQSRFIGAVAVSLMRSNSPYRQYYDNYKQRINSDPERIKCTAAQGAKLLGEAKDDKEKYEELRRKIWPPGRVHKAAIRYMLKILIKDFWVKWRTLEGLPVTPDYNEARRGYVHQSTE